MVFINKALFVLLFPIYFRQAVYNFRVDIIINHSLEMCLIHDSVVIRSSLSTCYPLALYIVHGRHVAHGVECVGW